MPFLRAALIEEQAIFESEALPYVEPLIEESIEADNDTPKDSKPVDGLVSREVIPPDDVSEDVVDLPDVQEVQEEQQAEPEQDSGQEAGDEFKGLPEEIIEAVTETSPEPEEPEPPAPTSHKDYSGDTLNYDFMSGERYVDTVSTKTEFDRMLDELASISKDLLSHEVSKFAIKFTAKFQGNNDKAEADAKKYVAFLGGYITNAAMILYDNGYVNAAIKQLDQAKNIIEARKKLDAETEAIKARVEEDNDVVDLTDILGFFGD